MQQPRARFLQRNLGQENCDETKAEDKIRIGDNIKICPLVSLGNHMQGKSVAEMKTEVCPWLHTIEYPDPALAFQPIVGWIQERLAFHAMPGTGLMKDLSFRAQGKPICEGRHRSPHRSSPFSPNESSPPGKDRISGYNTFDECCVNAAGKSR